MMDLCQARLGRVISRSMPAACVVVAVLSIIAVAIWSIARPTLEWDLLAYVAIVLQWNGLADPHNATYRDAADYAAAHGMTIKDLITGWNGIRDTVYQDPAAFAEQLPFYRVKPLYVSAVWLASHFTETVSAAAVWVSSLSVTILSGAILWFGIHSLGPAMGGIIATLFAFAPSTVACAGLGTPDGIGAMAIGIGIILFLKCYRIAGAVLLSIATLARPELRVFNLCLAAASLVFLDGERSTRRAARILIATVPVGFLVDHLSGSYGYAVLYHFTLDLTPHPAKLVGLGIEPAAFVRNIFVGLGHSLVVGFLWAVLAPLGFCLVLLMLGKHSIVRGPVPAVLAAVLAALAIRIVIFPSPELRFAEPMVAALTAVIIIIISYGSSSWTQGEATGR